MTHRRHFRLPRPSQGAPFNQSQPLRHPRCHATRPWRCADGLAMSTPSLAKTRVLLRRGAARCSRFSWGACSRLTTHREATRLSPLLPPPPRACLATGQSLSCPLLEALVTGSSACSGHPPCRQLPRPGAPPTPSRARARRPACALSSPFSTWRALPSAAPSLLRRPLRSSTRSCPGRRRGDARWHTCR